MRFYVELFLKFFVKLTDVRSNHNKDSGILSNGFLGKYLRVFVQILLLYFDDLIPKKCLVGAMDVDYVIFSKHPLNPM